MEVHAHTHTERKRFKHYLWEFLMLFLAVFCGFLAENLREHKVEKQRGIQYIRSFTEDLKTDTVFFRTLINTYREKNEALSTLYSVYDSIKKGFDCDKGLFKIIIHSLNFPDLVYTDRTMQQLKNAGGLRLLPSADADSITSYDNLIRIYQKSETTSFQESQTAIRNLLYSLVNFSITKDSLPPGTPGAPPLLFSKDKELINRYFNQLLLYSDGSTQNEQDLIVILHKAISLIEYFNKKYHLK